MILFLRHLIGWIIGFFRSGQDLILENLALRQPSPVQPETRAMPRHHRSRGDQFRLVVRALVSAHYYRPRLNRVLEAEEERLGSEADDSAFHASLL